LGGALLSLETRGVTVAATSGAVVVAVLPIEYHFSNASAVLDGAVNRSAGPSLSILGP
jgi:hypothetical protein